MPDDTNKKHLTALDPAVIASMKYMIAGILKEKEKPGYKEYDPKFPEYFQKLVESGLIPKDLGQWFLDHEAPLYDKAYKEMKEHKGEIMIINEQYAGKNAEDDIKKDIQRSEDLGEYFERNKCAEIIETDLKRNIFNSDKDKIRATKALMDRYFYLPELMEQLELTNTGGNSYMLSSQVKTPSMGLLKLFYDFIATSEENAQEIMAIYKDEMLTGGIKSYLACWSKSGEAGSFSFGCRLNEIVEQTYSSNRVYRTTQKERIDNWRYIKMLDSTKWKFIIKIKNSKKPVAVTFRMVEILGDRKSVV